MNLTNNTVKQLHSSNRIMLMHYVTVICPFEQQIRAFKILKLPFTLQIRKDKKLTTLPKLTNIILYKYNMATAPLF